MPQALLRVVRETYKYGEESLMISNLKQSKKKKSKRAY